MACISKFSAKWAIIYASIGNSVLVGEGQTKQVLVTPRAMACHDTVLWIHFRVTARYVFFFGGGGGQVMVDKLQNYRHE